MSPTLARRYIFKLAANLVSVPVYLVMEAILPRALGPQTYGNFSFATNLFQQLAGFLDMGTSTCFYNLLSRRQNEASLLAFYLRIAGFICLATLGCGAICAFTPAGPWIMPDMPGNLALFAAMWAYLTWWSRILRSTNDALGATIPSEVWRSLISITGLGLLVALFAAKCLNIYTLFLQQYLLLISLCMSCWLVTKTHWKQGGIRQQICLKEEQRCTYMREFFAYSHPLFIQALLSFIMLTAERWLLQWFDGSSQQGFYALSQKVGMACFLFVSAMTPLLMREFSVAWGKGDLNKMGQILTRFAPVLYAVAAYFSCFTLAEGRTIVMIFGGSQFLAATLPVQIMALYPLHQAYGQVASSVFHASGKTRVLRNITALECLYGLAAAWLLIAPANLGGLNLGAAGLAVKTVSIQFLSVNLYLWLASRFIPFSFWKNLLHQIVCVLILAAFAFAARYLSAFCPFSAHGDLWRFVISGIIYTSLAAAAVCLFPQIIGIKRQAAKELLRRARR